MALPQKPSSRTRTTAVKPGPPISAPSSPKKKFKKIAIIVVSLLILIPALGALWLYVYFAGGLTSLIHDAKPTPNFTSRTITAQRNEAKAALEDSFKTLDGSTGLHPYASATHDSCHKGQNNWKVRDGYAYRCSLRMARFYGFNDDFRQYIIDFEQKLYTLGWQATGDFSLKRVMEEYYDQFYGPDKVPPNDTRDGYLISNLPKPNPYTKGQEELEVAYAERASKDLAGIDFTQRLWSTSPLWDKQDLSDTQSVFADITKDNSFVLVVSIQKDYFQN